MTHILIQQGIEKGSKKWNKMQHFTNEQLDTEQVSPQEIMENIQQCMNAEWACRRREVTSFYQNVFKYNSNQYAGASGIYV